MFSCSKKHIKSPKHGLLLWSWPPYSFAVQAFSSVLWKRNIYIEMCTFHHKPFLVKPQGSFAFNCQNLGKIFPVQGNPDFTVQACTVMGHKQLWLRYSLTFWNNWCSCVSRWNIPIFKDCVFYVHISLGFSECKSLHFSFWIIGITIVAVWRWEVSCH